PFPRKAQPVCELVSPMKPLEAAAMQKAVLVSSVRALTEMINDGQTGLVFEKANIVDFADKMELLINNESLRNTLGMAAREWVQKERNWIITTKILHDTLHLIRGTK